MPSNYTENYNLNQWEPADRVLRTDFNADNAKIDAALKAVNSRVDGKADTAALAALQQVTAQKVKVALGTYAGDGTANLTISLDFLPKVMFIRCLGTKQMMDIFGEIGLYQSETRYQCTDSEYFTLTVTSTGITLSCGYSWAEWEKAEVICNSSGKGYCYAAFG